MCSLAFESQKLELKPGKITRTNFCVFHIFWTVCLDLLSACPFCIQSFLCFYFLSVSLKLKDFPALVLHVVFDPVDPALKPTVGEKTSGLLISLSLSFIPPSSSMSSPALCGFSLKPEC
ncbi:hypothetical protein ILYODFUR_000224 [Ilyodon furcidens]|uniref:Uncharacterized protein n=1 Tax=Ilyodon furcidens TaxID=33524 RepID=A0ABV0SVJ7_9TELE